jgi:uncharacterized membrane protein YfcA
MILSPRMRRHANFHPPSRRFALAGRAPRPQGAPVTKLCIFVGTTVVSTAFWYLGEAVGLEFFGCFMLSGVGSVLGVWLGWKVAQKLGE